jgi:hypothetical protein
MQLHNSDDAQPNTPAKQLSNPGQTSSVGSRAPSAFTVQLVHDSQTVYPYGVATDPAAAVVATCHQLMQLQLLLLAASK